MKTALQFSKALLVLTLSFFMEGCGTEEIILQPGGALYFSSDSVVVENPLDKKFYSIDSIAILSKSSNGGGGVVVELDTLSKAEFVINPILYDSYPAITFRVENRDGIVELKSKRVSVATFNLDECSPIHLRYYREIDGIQYVSIFITEECRTP